MRARRDSRRGATAPARMTPMQHVVLSSADPEGRLAYVDGRSIPTLARNGWVEQRTRRKGRRMLTSWHLTPTGTEALARAVVVQPRPRSDWRGYWTVEELERRRRWRVEEHQIWKPGRHMLWRVVCPARGEDDPIAYEDTLAEVIERLADHLRRPQCTPKPVNLDTIR